MPKYTYTIYRVDGTTERGEIEWPFEPHGPGYHRIAKLVNPIVEGELEQVSIRGAGGKPRDMFVNDVGRIEGRQRNEAATKLYRAAWVKAHPRRDPESVPGLDIRGVAVVFDQVIWK